MADLFIIGQFEGVAGTTAVSIGSQVMHMLTVMIVGLAMGTTVSIGQAIGANDKRRAANAIGNTVTLFAVVAAGMFAILLLLVNPILQVMSTPQEAVAGTRIYLTICFVGIPFIIAYNVISSIFRGLGDSKSPMYFIAIACVINIALDYLFMGAFHMGAAGAALGTTLSQAVSVVNVNKINCVHLVIIYFIVDGVSIWCDKISKKLMYLVVPVYLVSFAIFGHWYFDTDKHYFYYGYEDALEYAESVTDGEIGTVMLRYPLVLVHSKMLPSEYLQNMEDTKNFGTAQQFGRYRIEPTVEDMNPDTVYVVPLLVRFRLRFLRG